MNDNKKLCVVVPYRNREYHLQQFLPHIEKTLTDQNIDYGVLIVEQEDGKPFNRAKLLNVGFAYTEAKYDYYCFHDVDMLAILSDYSYCSNPTHLASEAEQFGYKLPYNEYFGGVTLFDRESFMKINGYSNDYWSWGGEDDDIYKRCNVLGVTTFRKPCRFQSLHHERNIDNNMYSKIIERLNKFSEYVVDGKIIEGLSTLEYELIGKMTLTEKSEKITVRI